MANSAQTLQMAGSPSFPIAAPPWTGLGRRLESACRKALHEFSLLEGVDSLAIALSGGKDSLTLLFLLKAILGRGFPSIPLTAIHVDGQFSCGAGLHTPFLKGICDHLDIELVITTQKQNLDGLNCYSCSRMRRKLLFDAAKERGIHTVAFGHHREDNIQTLLLNLLHKGEFAGNLPLVPMIDYGVTIIRPLYFIDEHGINKFANLHRFSRTMCQCVIGQDSNRKKVEELIEAIEPRFPNIRKNLAHAALNYGSKKALKK